MWSQTCRRHILTVMLSVFEQECGSTACLKCSKCNRLLLNLTLKNNTNFLLKQKCLLWNAELYVSDSRFPDRCCLCPCWGSGAARSAAGCESCSACSLGTSQRTPSPAERWGRRGALLFSWPALKWPNWCLGSSRFPADRSVKSQTIYSVKLICWAVTAIIWD